MMKGGVISECIECFHALAGGCERYYSESAVVNTRRSVHSGVGIRAYVTHFCARTLIVFAVCALFLLGGGFPAPASAAEFSQSEEKGAKYATYTYCSVNAVNSLGQVTFTLRYKRQSDGTLVNMYQSVPVGGVPGNSTSVQFGPWDTAQVNTAWGFFFQAETITPNVYSGCTVIIGSTRYPITFVYSGNVAKGNISGISMDDVNGKRITVVMQTGVVPTPTPTPTPMPTPSIIPQSTFDNTVPEQTAYVPVPNTDALPDYSPADYVNEPKFDYFVLISMYYTVFWLGGAFACITYFFVRVAVGLIRHLLRG